MLEVHNLINANEGICRDTFSTVRGNDYAANSADIHRGYRGQIFNEAQNTEMTQVCHFTLQQDEIKSITTQLACTNVQCITTLRKECRNAIVFAANS